MSQVYIGCTRIKKMRMALLVEINTNLLQGYNHIEGINFKETFALISCIESIRLLIGLACYIGFKLYQMDVRVPFLMV